MEYCYEKGTKIRTVHTVFYLVDCPVDINEVGTYTYVVRVRR